MNHHWVFSKKTSKHANADVYGWLVMSHRGAPQNFNEASAKMIPYHQMEDAKNLGECRLSSPWWGMKPWLFLGRENHEILNEINESSDRELSLKGIHDMCYGFRFSPLVSIKNTCCGGIYRINQFAGTNVTKFHFVYQVMIGVTDMCYIFQSTGIPRWLHQVREVTPLTRVD